MRTTSWHKLLNAMEKPPWSGTPSSRLLFRQWPTIYPVGSALLHFCIEGLNRNMGTFTLAAMRPHVRPNVHRPGAAVISPKGVAC